MQAGGWHNLRPVGAAGLRPAAPFGAPFGQAPGQASGWSPVHQPYQPYGQAPAWSSPGIQPAAPLGQAPPPRAPAEGGAAQPAGGQRKRPPRSSGAKEVVFVRHGQAEHNLLFEAGHSQEGGAVRDPGLTELGVRQAEYAGGNHLLDDVELAVVSPLRRTLQTAQALFKRRKGVPQLALPDLQECNDMPCDTGRPRSEIRQEFPDVDLSELDSNPEEWFVKQPLMREKGGVSPAGLQLLRQRLGRVEQWLAARPEQRLAVVAHHMVLTHLLGVDFSHCEVIEMLLEPQGDRGGASWSFVAGTGEVVPLYRASGQPVVRFGSNQLRGTLMTLRQHTGEDAVRVTCQMNGLPYARQFPATGWG